MPQTNYTPILIYASGTTGNTPAAGNLTNSSGGSELAINYFDGRLFYKDASNVVQVLATKGTGTIGGSNTQVQFNSSGALAGSSNMTFNGTTLSVNGLTVTNNPTFSGGTANGVLYLDGSKVVTSGSVLTFDGVGALAVNRPGGSTSLTLQSNDASTSAIFFGDQTSATVGRIEYNHATDAMPFRVAGNEAMRLNSTGLGIGTNNPGYKLHVNTSTVNDIARFEGSAVNGGFASFSDGTAVRLFAGFGPTLCSTAASTDGVIRYSGNLLFSRNAIETARMDSSGNLGIGASSPGAKLHINTGGNAATGGILLANAGNQQHFWYLSSNTTSTFEIGSSVGQWTWTNSNGEAMRLNSTGLGIGTNNPSTRIHAAQNNVALTLEDLTATGSTSGTASVNFRTGQAVAGAITAGRDGTYVSGATINSNLQFYTATTNSNTEKMRLDSSGNLGLGVTPSAWFGNSRAIQIGAGGVIQGRTNNGTILTVGANNYIDVAGFTRYLTTAAASLYEQNNGAHAWYNAASGTAGNTISFTQAMTLDASGNLGIGTTNPSYNFVLQAFTQAANGTTTAVVTSGANSTPTAVIAARGGDGVGSAASFGFNARVTASNGSTSGRLDTNFSAFNIVGRAVNSTFESQSHVAVKYISAAGVESEYLRLDYAGNLGLGVTPSAWTSIYRALQLTGQTALWAGSSNTFLSTNVYNDGGNSRYIGTGNATIYQQNAGAHAWYTAASGTAGNAISFTQAMTLDASGRLLLGTTSATGASMDIQGSASGVVELLNIQNTSTNAAAISRLTIGSQGGNWRIDNERTGAPLKFSLGASLYFTLDGSGNVVTGNAAIATNATNGFLYVPTCAGTPTGTPTTYTGRSPIVVDSTNNKLYFYSGGAWRDAGP